MELHQLGAGGRTADGEELGDRTVERDAALIELGLGCGGRHHTVYGMTTYELPPPSASVLNVALMPDRITKGDAGGSALVFEHRIRRVRAYVTGARTDLLDLTRTYFHPDRPIHLQKANDLRWEGLDHDGKRCHGLWNDTDIHKRHRMLNPDGTSPMLWLSVETGEPLSYYHIGQIIRQARNFTRAHINPDFPAGFRMHDLRHTFAVHMVVAIVRAQIARHLEGPTADAYNTRSVVDAVKLVGASLGHSPESGSTALYLTHASAQLIADIPDSAFLGVN